MPKVVMDELGLDITNPYLDLYLFDFRKFNCLGRIKDMVVTLSQLPMKSVLLDVIVVDIPPKFGMFFSISWAKKVGGTLQMDLSYATILVWQWGLASGRSMYLIQSSLHIGSYATISIV